jgi:hypothetical protein
MVVTGVAWRAQVCQQVFEEAAVDCASALTAWSDSRSGKRKGNRVGFPRFKKKTEAVPSFRLRNKHPRTANPRSVSVRPTPGRSPCPASGHCECMTTPVGCGACWPRTGPRSCSRPSPSTRVTGGSHSTSRPPICTPHTSTGGVARMIRAAGSVSTGACQRSWSPPPPMAPNWSVFTMRPRRFVPGCAVSGTSQRWCRARRKDRRTAARPRPGSGATTTVSPTCAGISFTGCPTSWSRLTTGSPSRTSTCLGCYAPPSGPSNLRRGVGRVRPPTGLQAAMARRATRGRWPLVPVEQALLSMRSHQHRPHAL